MLIPDKSGDDQYDKIAEAEMQTKDIRKRIRTIRSEQISGENVYQLLLAFRRLIERLYIFPDIINHKGEKHVRKADSGDHQGKLRQ